MKHQLYEMHAGICGVLGHAKRIQIIDILQDREENAGTLSQELGISKANLSQHLNIMKARGILLIRREGVSIFYRISNPKIVTACQLMREVLMEQLQDMTKLNAVSQ